MEEKRQALEEKHKAFEGRQKALEKTKNLKAQNLEMQRKFSQLEADLQLMVYLISNNFLLSFFKLIFLLPQAAKDAEAQNIMAKCTEVFEQTFACYSRTGVLNSCNGFRLG